MKLVFLLEEPSMKVLLDVLLPKIIPNIDFETIPHEGKSDLQKSIPRTLKIRNDPNVKFVVVHDQDSHDCKKLKQRLLDLCKDTNKQVLVRIVCKELESWYFGDLNAVSTAYDSPNLMKLRNKSKYRVVDNIHNAKLELRKHVSNYNAISGARKIAPHMDIDNNTSSSFGFFVTGVKRIAELTK
ncbi:MAG: DUF4276 family protein [Oscillospiraceae bacterium]|nr:DUF4276 family protein [Oscillospiraceae bacterium]MCL2247629.1 DUF4276 family protein [Lentimicrobiaceae bacterium]